MFVHVHVKKLTHKLMVAYIDVLVCSADRVDSVRYEKGYTTLLMAGSFFFFFFCAAVPVRNAIFKDVRRG